MMDVEYVLQNKFQMAKCMIIIKCTFLLTS